MLDEKKIIKLNLNVEIPQNEKNIDRHIGRKLKEKREESNLSQEELINKLKTIKTIKNSDSSLSDLQGFQEYELGEKTIPSYLLYGISKVLDVSVDWFFEV